MAGLLYKELVLHKKTTLLSLGMITLVMSTILIMPVFVDNDFLGAEEVTGLLSVFAFFMIFLTAGIHAAAFFEADESKKWAYYIASSPVRSEGQIKSKYLTVLLIYVALVFWCETLSLFLSLFGCPVNSFFAIIMMFVMLLANAIEIPFLVRFGCKVGSSVKTAAGMLITLIGMEFVLFGDTSMFSSAERFFGFIESISDTSAMADISLVIAAAFPYVSAALYYLSYKLSCKFYLKGVEEYVK